MKMNPSNVGCERAVIFSEVTRETLLALTSPTSLNTSGGARSFTHHQTPQSMVFPTHMNHSTNHKKAHVSNVSNVTVQIYSYRLYIKVSACQNNKMDIRLRLHKLSHCLKIQSELLSDSN